MKSVISKFSLLFFLTTLLIAACKKDAIKIETDRTYVQINARTTNDLASGTVMLTLRPDGTGGIAPGDIVYMAKYDISGDKLTVKVDEINRKFKFTIINDEELHGENGEILKRDHDQ